MLDRRIFMGGGTSESWDYILTYPYTKTPYSFSAGNKVTIEFAPSTNANGYIYYALAESKISPESQRVRELYKAGGSLVVNVLADVTLWFGTNDLGSNYYMFNGEYIKVRIS